MNPKIERLKAQQKQIEATIKKLEREHREASRASALRLIERAGLFDLEETVLKEKLSDLLVPKLPALET